MKAKHGLIVMVSAVVLLGTAMTGLAIERMKTVMDCKDARIYMDGSFRVFVQAGGLKHHVALKILKRNGINWGDVGTTEVATESNIDSGIRRDIYINPFVKLVISERPRPPLKGLPAQIDGVLGSELISAPLNCFFSN